MKDLMVSRLYEDMGQVVNDTNESEPEPKPAPEAREKKHLSLRRLNSQRLWKKSQPVALPPSSQKTSLLGS